MKILVTGGAGFIGSHLVDAYLARGDEVAILDNFSTGKRENLNPKATLFEINLEDEDAVTKAVSDFQPELINHQAAHAAIADSKAHPQGNANANIMGSLNLFEAARKAGVKRIVAASSSAVYGDATEIPTKETTPTEPVSPYGISKRTMELYFHYYQVEYGLAYVALRYANVYGPRQSTTFFPVVANLTTKLLNHQPIQLGGDGTQTRDLVFVADVVAANLAAGENGSGAYNVSTNRETSMNDLLKLIASEVGESAVLTFNPKNVGVLRSALDNSKAAAELQWQPKTSLEDGIKQTVSWYKTFLSKE